VRLENVQKTLDAYEAVCLTLDRNGTYLNTRPYGEPQLGRRGLYTDITVADGNVGVADALFWTLNLSDGDNDLLGIAERSGLTFDAVRRSADLLESAGLLRRLDDP
jgi:aminopeptidase-like protein